MNRAEFMAELRKLLSDITEAEREEALNYYEDYFDDAGVENEASVIAALGTPGKVAATIKDGLLDSEGTSGEFSEKGYTYGAYDNRDEIVTTGTSIEERKPESGGNGARWILLIILGLFALPILAPLLISLAAILFGFLCAIGGVLLAALLSGIAIVIGGVAVIVAGILVLIAAPPVGALLIGGGLIAMGIGILLAILGGWILVKVIPMLVRGVVNLCRRIFGRKRA